jgi:thiamine-phosphate pyrophosphorylase
MDRRQPLPRRWLMTDERQGDTLFDAVARLPAGAGIVFRHTSLVEVARRDLFDRVRNAHPGLLLLAGSADLARSWSADGSHGLGPGEGLRTAPAHDLAEIRAAETAGAALIFLSPVFATRSHPDAEPLGPDGFAALATQTRLPVVALGGMNEARAQRLRNAYGWAGIDAWGGDQKRKAVPI